MLWPTKSHERASSTDYALEWFLVPTGKVAERQVVVRLDCLLTTPSRREGDVMNTDPARRDRYGLRGKWSGSQRRHRVHCG